jgi:hypothetical protein
VQPATIQTEFASFKPSVLNSYGKSRRVEITLVDSE